MGKYLTDLSENLSALNAADVRDPNLPESSAVQEALDLKQIATKHKEKLLSRNLDWSLVESLPARAAALQEAKTAYHVTVFGSDSLAEQWDALVKEATAVREELTHALLYAFDDHQNLIDAVQKILEGDSYADLTQDMSDLEGVSNDNKELLEAANVDFNLVKRAGELKTILGEMLAKVNVEKLEKSPEKDMRDRAFTYLELAVSKIRKCGKSVFWNDQERARLFASAYLRKMRRKYEKNKAAEDNKKETAAAVK